MFCQENALVIANTIFQQHKRRLYTWTSPDGKYWNQIYYIICSQRWKSSMQSAKTRPGADCDSDHKLLITKFRLKLKKVGKTARPFRYDLNQILYDYRVEVRNRFKGLDLIECLMNYGMRFMTLFRRQGSRPSPWKRNAKKQNGCPCFPWPTDQMQVGQQKGWTIVMVVVIILSLSPKGKLYSGIGKFVNRLRWSMREMGVSILVWFEHLCSPQFTSKWWH